MTKPMALAGYHQEKRNRPCIESVCADAIFGERYLLSFFLNESWPVFSSLFSLPGSMAIIIVRSAATTGPPRTTRSAATVGPPRIQRLPIKNNVQFARRVFVRTSASLSWSVDDLSVVNWWLVSVRCRWIVQVKWVRSAIYWLFLCIYMRETNPS